MKLSERGGCACYLGVYNVSGVNGDYLHSDGRVTARTFGSWRRGVGIGFRMEKGQGKGDEVRWEIMSRGCGKRRR
jgi:hypothetical protein